MLAVIRHVARKATHAWLTPNLQHCRREDTRWAHVAVSCTGCERKVTMPNIEVNGAKLEYVEQGTGQPIVFVHGVLNDLRSWKDQMEAFGSNYRAVALSCRYY